MAFSLHQLPARPGRRSRRVGRGHGSGRGTYAARGIKGQRARTGGRKGIRRRALSQTMSKLPKQRGFRSRIPSYLPVNIGILEKHFSNGATIGVQELARLGFRTTGHRGIKILGDGALTKKLTVCAHAFSASAARAITSAGGSIVRLTNGK